MTLRIVQDSRYVPTDYWEWSVWLAGEARELEEVEQVTWFLHPTFDPSVVVSRSRENGFRLDTEGWGTFVIRAIVRHLDGRETKLRHWLELFYPDGEGPARRRPRLPPADQTPNLFTLGKAAPFVSERPWTV